MAATKSSPKAKNSKTEAKTETPYIRDQVTSQVEKYRDIAQRFASGEPIMRPLQLTGHARRIHVRDTIIEDHATRIDKQAKGAAEKFEKLSGSLFSFFRGTSLLYHRDMAGEDAHMPTVMLLGDVHPGNFGVMPNADNVPIFGVNDFDDAIYGPFSWDLKRGATGFRIAVMEEGGYGPKHQRKIARSFVEGYLDGIAHFAHHQTEAAAQIRPDNSPKVIRRLFEEAATPREKWLRKRYHNESGRGFRANEEFTPVSSRIDEFQKQMEKLADRQGISDTHRLKSIKVKDVAIRHGQGTASLGLPRFYVLLEGPKADASDDLIIEFKRARLSALEGLVPDAGFFAGHRGDRIAHGQSVHLAEADVFYGEVEIDGMSFMSRERAPFREDIDMDDLSKKTWRSYARVCGHALAQAHARSDEAGQLHYDVEPLILEASTPQKLFMDDIMEFSEEAVDRLRRDHEFFKEDHAQGAFKDLRKSFR